MLKAKINFSKQEIKEHLRSLDRQEAKIWKIYLKEINDFVIGVFPFSNDDLTIKRAKLLIYEDMLFKDDEEENNEKLDEAYKLLNDWTTRISTWKIARSIDLEIIHELLPVPFLDDYIHRMKKFELYEWLQENGPILK
ncbi:hypothetical protein [[Mycoplasma] anseris]|uniref:Uncharacterized protein n=1 Tax=[Mycoplasma] anseris TaxID=92400 RepID=A0A2Z4NCA6_9BACT|nr:hypothetical protein [[Mycoplasma] anseris]AWX69191.1 hypothetical protein DP065_00215 [[Mycoplasma] anseris]